MSKTTEIAQRLKGLRQMMEISHEEMALVCNLSVEDYLAYEEGVRDFSVSMLCQCASRLKVDVTELFSGVSPRLGQYTVVRADEGMSVERREGFKYGHLAFNFKKREAEPFLVSAPFNKLEQDSPIALSSHAGQEMDYVLSGAMRISVGGKEEILRKGDCIYYDSSLPHGMVAIDGEPCKFLAIILNK